MFHLSESYQNYQHEAVTYQLTDGGEGGEGREESFRGDSKYSMLMCREG